MKFESQLEKKKVPEHVECVVGFRSLEKRKGHNEDQPIVDPEHGLYGILDGMGGHKGGGVASQFAAKKLLELAGAELEDLTFDSEGAERLRGIGDEVNAAIRKAAEGNPDLAGMATTLSFLRLGKTEEGELKGLLLHVGDSRIYLYRDGNLTQLTKDDSLARYVTTPEEFEVLSEKLNEATSKKDLTENEYHFFKQRARVAQAIGTAPRLKFQVESITFLPGDRIVFTTDGAHDNSTGEEIEEDLGDSRDPQTAADRISEHSRERSKDLTHFRAKEDDITVVVVEIPDADTLMPEKGNTRDKQQEVLRGWAEKWRGEIQQAKDVNALLRVVERAGAIPGKNPGELIRPHELNDILFDAEEYGDYSKIPAAGGYRARFIEIVAERKRKELRDAA